MADVTQQIQAAVRKLAPKIYNAVIAQPTAAGRAQALRYVLTGIDPALSERVAASIEALVSRGTPSRAAVLQAIEIELRQYMHGRAAEITGELSGLGTNGTTTTVRRTGAAAMMSVRNERRNSIAGMISTVGDTVNALTQTAGNIAVSAVQARTRQTVTGLPGMPQPAAASLGPDPYGPAGYGPPPPAGPPWGLIIGGVAAVAVLGGAYWYTTQQKKPAAAAAA